MLDFSTCQNVARSGMQRRDERSNWIEKETDIWRLFLSPPFYNCILGYKNRQSIHKNSLVVERKRLCAQLKYYNWISPEGVVKMKYWFHAVLLLLSLNAVASRKSREIRIVSANTKHYNDMVNIIFLVPTIEQ